MTQTRMIVDTKSILELPMYNQENVLRYLEKDHVEMATTFKAWEEKAKGIVQNNKTKREKLNSKREKSEVQPDDQHVALTNELLDLLDGLVHHGLHQYRPTLVSKYKNLLIWKDQEKFDFLDESNLDWLTKNVLTEELVRKQVAQEKLDTYKALMSDKQLTREVVASIKQSKEYSEEIKKALISEINPSEEAKKNNIKKISVIKQEFFIRKQLLEVLKERVATDKTYQPLFEQIEKATNSNEKQKEHVTA